MTFIDRNDGYRKKTGMGTKAAESMLRRSHPVFGVPMPAFGEAICKTMEKGRESDEMFGEMGRLMESGFIVPMYIKNAEDTYGLAKRICSSEDDDRAAISPMDGLILATAAANPDCTLFYTSDSKLLMNPGLNAMLDEYCVSIGAEPICIGSIRNLVP